MLVVVAHRAPAERARMRTALEDTEVDVLDARDDVLGSVRRHRPDVVLVDEPAVVREIASDPDLLSTSVVLIGADASVDAALEALASGAHDVLPDPPSPAELVARVRAAARAAALRSQLLAREATLEQLAYNDELTGLWNRRFMQRRLSAALRAAERHSRRLSVALVDIDHFKDVNDRFGHAAGDAVLIAVAQRLRDAVREEDVIGRWGGEEFLILLPEEPAEGAIVAADRIREHVGALPIETPEATVNITVSVGCATFRSGERPDDVLRRADDALYEAKRAGRNAVAS
ncbi:MAG TPA: diguanylate cyclase [Capillimicrobium sp.]|jgi:two-component system cell cycle response regulator